MEDLLVVVGILAILVAIPAVIGLIGKKFIKE